MTALIAYRSPAGRVVAYRRSDAIVVEHHEPGLEADAAWERLGRTTGVVMKDRAEWLDRSPSWRDEPGDEPEKENETMAKKTTENNEAVVKPKVKRPRSGCWTKTSRQIPIPGTKSDTADLDMYCVEFKGETLEVQRNREGVKKANSWIRAIKARAELGLKVERLRLALLVLAQEADEETAGRLKGAAEMLGVDAGGDGAE